MSFEKLRVYQAAELLDREVKLLIEAVPRGHGEDVSQLENAVGSVLFNIPEANGSERKGRKHYHLEIARGSADEARGVLRRLVADRALKQHSVMPACALTSTIAKCSPQ